MNANTNLNVLGSILDAMLANLTEHIDKRVEAKVFTLTERIEVLEKAVENHKMASALNHTVTHSLIDEVEKLDALKGAGLDLQSTEFACAVQKVIDMYAMNDGFIMGIIDNDLFNDKITDIAHDAASSAADEALDTHTSDYDHDDIHEMSDHEIDEDAVREVVEEVLNNVTVTLKI